MKTIEGNFQNANGKYAILVGRFNSFVVESLLQGSIDTLKRHGVSEDNITVVRAPGAWELPLVWVCYRNTRSGYLVLLH